jgi:hypothetical protein
VEGDRADADRDRGDADQREHGGGKLARLLLRDGDDRRGTCLRRNAP